MRKFAWLGIKRRKKQMHILMTAVVLSIIFIMFTSIVKDSMIETTKRNRQETYGIWTGAMYNSTPGQIEALMNHQAIEQIGKMQIYGIAVDETGREAGGIGTIDKTAFRLGKICVKKGKLPERKGEIAMEEKMLKRLGISYKYGKTVSFAMTDGGSLTYRLCGVIEDYSEKWKKEDFSLVSGIVSETREPKETHLFFYGEKYEKLSKMEELEIFKQPRDGSKLIKNKMAYDNVDIEMEKMLQSRFLTIFLAAVSMCIIFYIQLLQFQQRRNSLVTMRGIGASKEQIFFMLLWENIYVLKCALPLGVATGMTLPCVLLKLLGFRIAVQWSTIIYAIVITVTAFLMSTLLLYVPVQKLQLTSSFRTGSSITKRKRFPRIRKVKRLTAWKIFLRRRYFAGRQTWIRNGVLLFGVLFIVTACISASVCYESYSKIKLREEADYGWWGKKYGLSIEDIQNIKNVEGIDTVKICLGNREEDGWDTGRRISWERFEESTYLKEQNLVAGDWINVENIDIQKNLTDELGEYYKSCMEGKIDEDAFRAGEEVILVLPSYVKKGEALVNISEQELPYVKDCVREQTIRPGDEIHVTSPYAYESGFDKTVKVAGIIRNWKEKTPKQQQIAWKAGDLIVSPAFEDYEEIPSEENIEEYPLGVEERIGCYLYAYADSNADVVQMDEKLSNLMEERLYKFTNHREEREMTMHMQLSFCLLCIGLAVVAFVICFMVLLNGQQMRMREEHRQNQILQFLGMDAVELRKIYLLEGFTESIFLFVVNSMIVLSGYSCYVYASTAVDTVSGVIGYVMDFFPWELFILVECIYFLVYVCMTCSLLKESRKWELS